MEKSQGRNESCLHAGTVPAALLPPPYQLQLIAPFLPAGLVAYCPSGCQDSGHPTPEGHFLLLDPAPEPLEDYLPCKTTPQRS